MRILLWTVQAFHGVTLLAFMICLEGSQFFPMSRHFVLSDSRLAAVDFLPLSSLVLPTLIFFPPLVWLICAPLCAVVIFPLHDDYCSKKEKVQQKRSSVKILILVLLLVLLSRWSITLVLPSMRLLLQEPQGWRRRWKRHLLQRALHFQLRESVRSQLSPGNGHLRSSQSSVTSSYQGPNPG